MSAPEEDQPAHMWPYWRDKKGYEAALRDYYPNISSQPTNIWIAAHQLRDAKASLDRAFKKLADEAEETDE